MSRNTLCSLDKSPANRPRTSLRALYLTLSVSALAACDGTIHRSTELGGVSVLSIDARQRIVITGTRIDANGQERTVTCAEPSPDAIVAQASYLAGKANVDTKASGQIAAGLSESAASLGVRTQSIQLLRDGYYRICEAYLNGAIGPSEYRQVIDQIDQFMIVLVAIEAITGVVVAPAISIGSGGTISFGKDGTDLTGTTTAAPQIIKEIKAQSATLTDAQVTAVTRIIQSYFAARRR